MRNRQITRCAALLCSVSLMDLFVSVNYSNNNKATLLKNNIEAISDSNSGTDPSGRLRLKSCYTSIKSKKNSTVNKCKDGSTTFSSSTSFNQVYGAYMTIYGCDSYSNYGPAFNSDWGQCYE